VTAAATPINDDVDSDVGAIAGVHLEFIQLNMLYLLSNCPRNLSTLWEEYEFV
jgi:hypothetical protein